MKKLKLLTIVGTRPEIIRLSRILPKLDVYFDHTVIHTGQNYDYELNEIFFKELGLRKPDFFLGAAGNTPSSTIGNILISVDPILQDLKPDAAFILGDTNSALSAISCKKNKVPIFHFEAGNRCFDQRVPEEINRKIVDHIADVNLTYSSLSRENLIQEGLSPDRVIKIGSPMKEVLNFYKDQINDSKALENLNLNKHEYFLVSAHREENVDGENRLSRLISILNSIAEQYRMPVVFSVHPRTNARLKQVKLKINPLVNFCMPFGFFDYIKLQTMAKCVLSDSGTLTEEANLLNFPALALRETQERHEGLEEGAVMFVGLSNERVMQGLKMLEGQGRVNDRAISIVAGYDVANVSDKVLRIIQSYTDYINRVVWGIAL